MGAAFIGCRGGDGGGSYDVEHRSEGVGVVGVPNADRPGCVGSGVPPDGDVATRVYGEVAVAVGFEEPSGAFDGPSFDDTGRVEGGAVRRWYGEGVEGAIGVDAKAFAEQQDIGDVAVDVGEGDLASTEPGDGAVVDIGAEGLVDVMKPGDGLVETATARDGVADVERHSGAHHLFDVVESNPGRSAGIGHHAIAVRPAARAASMADWSERR